MRSVQSTLILCACMSAMALAAAAPAPAAASASAPTAAPKEVIDTTDAPAVAPAPVTAEAPPAADTTSVASDSAIHVALAALPTASGPLEIRNNVLSRLDLSGTIQLKGFYHDLAADRDADKQLTLQLRRFKLGLEGHLTDHAGFKGRLLLDGANKAFGLEDAYLFYRLGNWAGIKGGKINRPFSQEALQSSNALYTIERGELYHNFLANTTGYAWYDLGLMAYGGFEEDDMSLGYEVGLFNGKQNDDPAKDYSNQQDEKTDKGFKAKDLVLRLNAKPSKLLKLELGVSSKAAENTSNASDFVYAVNTAYQAGLDFHTGHLRLLGELAWGDNHKKVDAKIIDGSVMFFVFYATGVWREDYARGRASELVLKLEGLDPDFEPGEGEGAPNDGKLKYTLGVNWFFTPAISVMANYGVLQPITKVAGEDDLVHDVDVLWRMSW